MKEVFISFAVFVICVSLTIFSQFNSPQVVNAAETEPQLVQQTPLAKPTNVSNNNLFEFNETFFKQFVKIIFASIMMGIFFQYLILFFENQLSYTYLFKSAYLLLCVLFTIIFYLFAN